MGKVLVFYHSNTGNTEKMASLVAKGAKQVSNMVVRLRSLETITISDLEWCDGIALGAPTNYGSIPWKMKRWWDEEAISLWPNIDGKIATVFSSSGSLGGGNEVACMGLMTLLINFGFLTFGVTDYVGFKHSLHYGAVQAGSPRSEVEQEACYRLGRRLAEWVGIYIDNNPNVHPLKQSYPRLSKDF